MPYPATVIPVMIASPGDVQEFRTSARDILHEWNYIHSDSLQIVLMPVGWETHSSPELGSRPQELINDRVLKDCDLLVGIFWTRLGTPTGETESGTVEEIKRHVAAGKPAMLYFNSRPVSEETVDRLQFDALKAFRTWCQTQGLVETFFTDSELREKLKRHVQLSLYKNNYLRPIFDAASSGKIETTVAAPLEKVDEASALATTLSRESAELLLSASRDPGGTILVISMLAGKHVQAGQKQFGDMNDRRSLARWEYAVQQLSTLGLIDRTNEMGKRDQIFEVNQRGYEVANAMERNIK